MQQICNLLRTNGSMDFGEISEVVPWIELAADQGQDLEAPQVAEPRCFKSHCWYDHCPKHPEARYIIVVRNPADVALSFFKFFQGWFFEEGEVDLDVFVHEFWLARGVPASKMQNASFFVHLLSWWNHRHDENVLWLHYEDLKDNLPACIRRVAQHMRLPNITDDLIQMAAEKSSLAFMKAHEDQFNERLSKLARNKACGLPEDAGLRYSKIRSGEVDRAHIALSKDTLRLIQEKWEEMVGKATGHMTYDAFRAATNAELGHSSLQ